MSVQNTDNQKLKVSSSTPISSLTFGLCIGWCDKYTFTAGIDSALFIG